MDSVDTLASKKPTAATPYRWHELKFEINTLVSIIQAENHIQRYKMNFEKCRLETFLNWPIPYISVQELAKSGFYYLGLGDKVKCNFCDLEVHKWAAGDIPKNEHKKWSPHCPLMLGKSIVNKIMKTSETENMLFPEANLLNSPIKTTKFAFGWDVVDHIG